jgi:UDP:flavonoid glycosyltransferase YjiC (YdhE family)
MDDNELDSAVEYAFRFGEIAIKKGFITAQQLEEALDEQIADDLSNNHHRLIGEILLEQGEMTPKQIAIVLEELVKNKNQRSKAL